MKVLWISNIIFPEALSLLHNNTSLKSTGGWMIGASSALVKIPSVSLYVISSYDGIKKPTTLLGVKIVYYLLPMQKNARCYDSYWDELIEEIKPDVVHIHGTESYLGNSYIFTKGSNHVVLSIQGVVHEIANYYYSGISKYDIFKNITIRDLLRGTIWHDKKQLYNQGQIEKDILSKVHYVIGRTSFDRAHVLYVNPNLKYYFCNETLRSEFYSGLWNFENCKKHSIFMAQAQSPIKGLHILLKALHFVIQKYPDTTLRIAGRNIVTHYSFKDKIRLSGYGNYINSLIKRLHLENHVVFTGPLDSDNIKKEMLNCNVFVCPSSIENSPNSLCEAQLLGVPCIGSNAGGIPDLIPSITYGTIYRFEDDAMLAQSIIDIFTNSKSFCPEKLKKEALKRHDADTNASQTFAIYQDIINHI